MFEARRAKAALRSLGEGGLLSMYYVYLIQSQAFPEQRYVGFTADLAKRFATHNAGGSTHTAKYKPWKLVSYHAFQEKRRAQEFEYYLKTGSGKAFANKRLW
jgi:putative endonuclease